MMRPALASACLLGLAFAPGAAADPAARSPFASWAEDVAAPSASAAGPFLGRRHAGVDSAGAIDRGRPLRAALDRSGPLIRADVAHAAGRTGRGVLIGIIDTGVDYSHHAFLDPAGRSRIIWYLDLTLPSRGARADLDDLGFALFDGDDLAAALADPAAARPSADVAGHGTRVASIAAGADPTYTGIAPEASLVVVRADRLPGGRYDEVDVADAVRFVFAAADRLGRPAVVNLSLGGQLGAHDGTSHLEAVIDELAWAGPGGRAVVVAAGNDAASGVHARLDGTDADHDHVVLVVPPNAPLDGAAAAVAFLDVWGAPGATFSLRVSLPDGTEALADPGGDPVERPLADGAALRLEPGPAPSAATRTEALVALTGGGDGSIPPGRYVVTVRGPGVIDAYLSAEAQASLLPFRLEGDVRPAGTLAIPATARGAIAVGALVVRTAWSNHLGRLLQDPASAPESTVASFSSLGPTADARLKPDLLAPGAWVFGAQSTAAPWPDGPGGFPATAPDPAWSAARGTSLAAPHVAGLVALILQREPLLSPSEIVDRLRATAAGDGSWTGWRGFGVADAAAALDRPPPAAPGTPCRTVLSLAECALAAAGPRLTTAAITVRTLAAQPRSAGLPPVRVPDALSVSELRRGDVATATVDASRLPPGACTVLVAGTRDGCGLGSATLCVEPRGDAPAACAFSPGPAPSPASSLLSLAVVLAGALLPTRRAARPRLRATRFVLLSLAIHALLPLLFAPLLASLLPHPHPTAGPALTMSIERYVETHVVPPPPAAASHPPAPAGATPAPAPPPVEEPTPRPARPPRRPLTRAGASPSPIAAARGPGVPPSAEAAAALAGAPPAGVADSSPPAPPARAAVSLRPGAGTAELLPVPVDPCPAAAARVRRRIDAEKRYPPLARRRGVVGSVDVAFETGLDGALRSATVRRSSGSALLDEAALDAVRRAAPFAAPGCAFTVPVNFVLTD